MSSSCAEDEQDDRLSDEYHEDSLPDLVLDACPGYDAVGQRHSSFSSLKSKSSLDLLDGQDRADKRRSGGSKNGSVPDLANWEETEYGAEDHEIITEMSSSRRGLFKVSYVDHKKTYVPRLSHNDRYRSFLSLMPEGQAEAEDESKAEQILSDFRALSYEEQQKLREEWAQELEAIEIEMNVIKEKLAIKTAWCGVLRRNLGLTGWRRISHSCKDHVSHWSEITANNFQAAMEATETKIFKSQSLQKAKESFEALTNEVRERMRHGKMELVKKVANMKLKDNQANVDVSPDQTDSNSNRTDKAQTE